WVFLEVDDTVQGQLLPGPSTGSASRSPGTMLLTRGSLGAAALSSDQVAVVLREGSLAFESMHDVVLWHSHNSMSFYTWSDDQCCLPAGATEATLRNDKKDIHLAPGDALVFEEVISPVTGQTADADPTHRAVVRLTSVIPGTDPLDSTP